MKYHKIDAQGRFLVQRVTTTQRNLCTPSIGRVLYDTDLDTMYYGDGSNWNEFGSGTQSVSIPLQLTCLNITGTSDVGGLLTQTQTGAGTKSGTYNIVNFTGGAGFNTSAIRAIYIRCNVRQVGSSQNSTITCTYPDGVVRTILQAFSNVTATQQGTGSETIVCLPINKNQTSFTITLNCNDASGVALYQILSSSQIIDSNYSLSIFTGATLPFGGTIAPPGWLFCNGTAISKITYANLFTLIGYKYGGSGANFNLPDLRGRFVVGANISINVPADLTRIPSTGPLVTPVSPLVIGSTNGEYQHKLTVGEIPSHRHEMGSKETAHYAGQHCAGVQDTTGTGPQTSDTGGNLGHNNIPPYLTFNYIIKT